jgi:hypothetical protein
MRGSFLRPFLSQCVIAGSASVLAVAGCGGTSGSPATVQKDSGPSGIVLPIVVDAGVDAPTVAPHPDASTMHDATAPVDAGVDVAKGPTDAELNTYPSFAPDVPQVVSYGGPVLANPIFVPVIFAGDEYESQIEAYLAAVGPSQYWSTAVSEYGVGPGSMGTPIILNETLPPNFTDTEIQTWLANRIGTDPRFGALPGTSLFDGGAFDAGSVDATAPLNPGLPNTATAPTNAIYVLFIPQGTSVSMGSGQQGGTSCVDFGGYHNSFYYGPNGSNVVYAMIPRCGSFGDLSGFDSVSGPTSHEIAEAATDPFVGGNGDQAAYATVDDKHIFWASILGGGEVGDMCAQFPTAFYHPSEASMSAYTVQRIWSNKSAAAGHDPCVPELEGESFYFNAAPNFGIVHITEFGHDIPTLGVSSPQGTSTPIELDLFSDAPTGGPWAVRAIDANQYLMGGGADLIFSPATVSGVNGDKVTMTISNLNNDGQVAHPFLLVSTNTTSQSQNWWIGVVTN